MSWGIAVGEELKRRRVHDRYGGNRQRGITTIQDSSAILLFEYETGLSYGYSHDGPHADGTYHYTGEGPDGDQVFRGGNAAIRDHRRSGRVLRLFKETKPTSVQYLGEYVISEDLPWYRADSAGRDGELRSVIVFRLRAANRAPIFDATPALDISLQEPAVVVLDIDLEAHKAETFQINSARPPTNAERREADLVQRYAGWLRAVGHAVCRKQITLPGQARALYTDLFDITDAELVEAKGAASRIDVRLALGQVLDYDRFVESDQRAILLPVRPAEDLVELLIAHQVACIYETQKGTFERADPAR
jgi:hypothetical protein